MCCSFNFFSGAFCRFFCIVLFWAAKSLWFFTTFSNRSQKSQGSAMATKCFRNWETNGGICDSSGISKVILYIYIYSTSILGRIFIHIKATSYEFFLVHWKYPKLELENFVIKRGLIVLGQQHGNTSGSLVLSGVGCHSHPKNSFRSWVFSRFLLT